MSSFTKVVGLAIILVLPFGYYTGTNDSSHVAIGGGVGFGKYATLIQGCEGGEEVHMVNFREFSGSIAARPTGYSPLVLGFRGGYLMVEDPPESISGTEYYPATSANGGYINPNISLEFKPFGVGGGWFRNLGTVYPPNRWRVERFDFRRSRDFPSGHIRIGATDSWFGVASFCEGVPAMTQYGTILGAIGRGKPGGNIFMGGICGGLHRHAGVFGSIVSKPGKIGTKVFAARIGRNLGAFEGSVSFAWYFPLK